MVKLVNIAMGQFSETSGNNNAFLVDVFPMRKSRPSQYSRKIHGCVLFSVRYVPAWFPGAAWKRKIPQYRQNVQNMLNTPFDWVKQQMASHSFCMCTIAQC